MGKLKDLTGQRFGKLIVVERAENDSQGNAQWLCKCDCGNKKVIRGYQLTNNKTKSCGCLVGHNNETHKKSRTRMFNIWINMIQRCNNPKNSCYKYYGNKNIQVTKEWLDFENFYNWASTNGYTDKLTIDRIDNNGNYEPNNCRWVDMKTQQRNRSNNNLITINGDTKCLAEWCIIYHISPSAVWLRTQKGIDIVTAITTPSRTRSKRYDG